MATNSIRSDALEPTAADLKHASRGARLTRLLPVYGLPILALLHRALFLILPDTFPTILNLRSIIADKAIIAPSLRDVRWCRARSTSRSDTASCCGTFWRSACGLCRPALAASVAVVLGPALVGLISGILVEVAFIDPSSRRSAPARRFTRSRSGTQAGGRCSARCQRGSLL